MRALRLIPLIFALSSCTMVSSFVHEGSVVAKVGTHKLYSSEVENYIPKGLSSEDSTALALQYINSWSTDQLFMDTAEKELSKAELDVRAELEDYKRSLIKYRYEQLYVNQRLDTLVSDAQISSYYEAHKEQFTLPQPIVKARFLKMSGKPSAIGEMKKFISSGGDKFEADSVLFSSALKYSDYDGKWISSVVLAREFGMDYPDMLASVKGGFVQEDDPSGGTNIAYIWEIVKAGETGPIEYYREMIKDIILSSRKQALLAGLERDLLTRARQSEILEIY